MARNKSENRLRKLQAYYNALHDYWPKKRGGHDDNDYYALGAEPCQEQLGTTFMALAREDRLVLIRTGGYISRRFAWMDKQLGQTV